MNFDDAVVIRISESDPEFNPTTFMNDLLAKYAHPQKIVVLTDIECNERDSPCGCSGYSVCGWHGRWYYDGTEDFAPCLCSKNTGMILCDYHLRLQ
jgi:hypothetical protein